MKLRLTCSIFSLLLCTRVLGQIIVTDKITQPTCFNDSTGRISIAVKNGIPPIYYNWEDSPTEMKGERTGLKAGKYRVSISDISILGSPIIKEFELINPPKMEIYTRELCERDWVFMGYFIGVDSVKNAKLPIAVSEFDGNKFKLGYFPQKNEFRTDGREHTVLFTDSLGCQEKVKLISDPMDYKLSLTPDSIFLNSLDETVSKKIDLTFSFGIDSIGKIAWYKNQELIKECIACTSIIVDVKAGDTIHIKSTDWQTCRILYDTYVYGKPKIINSNAFLPSVFSPNNDGINDQLTIYSADGVEKVRWMRVFDIWGNLVFEQKDFPPSDNHYGWDGTYKGIAANMGIYTCTYRVLLKDGTEKTFNNSVSLMR